MTNKTPRNVQYGILPNSFEIDWPAIEAIASSSISLTGRERIEAILARMIAAMPENGGVISYGDDVKAIVKAWQSLSSSRRSQLDFFIPDLRRIMRRVEEHAVVKKTVASRWDEAVNFIWISLRHEGLSGLTLPSGGGKTKVSLSPGQKTVQMLLSQAGLLKPGQSDDAFAKAVMRAVQGTCPDKS
jgi:hypothetical protein